MTLDVSDLMSTFARCSILVIAISVASLLLGSCSPTPDTADTAGLSTEPEASSSMAPPPMEMPKAVLPDGFEVTLELAITPEELAQGLMFRPRLPDDRGMLLIFAEERLPSIWMMNTHVALDLVYLDSTGVVVDVITDAQPCPAEPCPRFTPKLPSKAVLEIPSGSATLHGVTVGLQLGFTRVPDFPVPG